MQSIENINLSVGGEAITGFATEAINFANAEDEITSKKGLDNIVWVVNNPKANELIATISLSSSSKSVATLARFAVAKEPVNFFFKWEDIGVEISTLEALVIAPKDLAINAESPDIVFEIRLKNFDKLIGLS